MVLILMSWTQKAGMNCILFTVSVCRFFYLQIMSNATHLNVVVLTFLQFITFYRLKTCNIYTKEVQHN